MASATLGALATELASASWARCKRRWTILGVPPEEAEALAKNPTVGAPGPNVRARLGRPVTVITAEAGSGKSLLLDRLMQRAIARYREQEGAPLPVFIDATRVRDRCGRRWQEGCDRLADPTSAAPRSS
jgi:type II secretory pathway predicted ATPase ExeA